MTLKELAHLAQLTLQARAGCSVKRSHVHGLLAAAFGHRSWAAVHSESVLSDAGVGSAPTGGLSELIGRAVQLGYPRAAALALASTLQAFIAEHGLSAVSWADLRRHWPRRKRSTTPTWTTREETNRPRLRLVPPVSLASS